MNTARQPLLNESVFCRKQATIRPTSGIRSLHKRHTSEVQADCCSHVPRYSSDDAELINPPPPPRAMMLRTIQCVRIRYFSFTSPSRCRNCLDPVLWPETLLSRSRYLKRTSTTIDFDGFEFQPYFSGQCSPRHRTCRFVNFEYLQKFTTCFADKASLTKIGDAHFIVAAWTTRIHR